MDTKEFRSLLETNFSFLKFTVTEKGFKASNGHTGIGYAGHYLDEMRFQELDELEKEGLKYDYEKYGAREIPKVS